MARYVALGSIAFGTSPLSMTESDSLDLWLGQGTPVSVPDKVILYTEEDAFTGTISVEWSDDDSNWVAHYDANRGAAMTLAAVTVLAIEPLQRYLRVNSDGTEGDAATISLFGLYYD